MTGPPTASVARITSLEMGRSIDVRVPL
jgi:hypothetical protein